MPPTLTSTVPAALAAVPTTRRAGWLLPAGLLFVLLLLGRWAQVPAALDSPRAAATRPADGLRPPLRPTSLNPAVVSAL